MAPRCSRSCYRQGCYGTCRFLDDILDTLRLCCTHGHIGKSEQVNANNDHASSPIRQVFGLHKSYRLHYEPPKNEEGNIPSLALGDVVVEDKRRRRR